MWTFGGSRWCSTGRITAGGCRDTNGTPLGAAALDIPANSSRWVRSPSFLAGLPGGPSEVHRCLFAQVFHPCDTELLNNCGYNNFVVVAVLRSWNIHHLPFTAHFANKDGPLTLAFEAPDGVNVHVVRGRLPEGPADAFEERETIQRLFVKRGVPQELSLVVENAGADFGPGDTFDVTVKALHNQREVSSFTVRFQVGEQGG